MKTSVPALATFAASLALLLASGPGKEFAALSREAGRAAPLAQSKAEKDKKSGPAEPSSALLAEDKGKFRILLDGQPMGTEEFSIKASSEAWTARGTTDIHAPGGASKVTATLLLAPDGAPRHYEWSARGQKKAGATIEFVGGTAKIALEITGSQPFLQELSFGSPRVLVLDNNLYHHYAILARLYDWKAKGSQTFPVLISQDMTPGSLTVESIGTESLDGAAYEVLRVSTVDIEVRLYLDAGHRLMRLTVPASKAVVIRE